MPAKATENDMAKEISAKLNVLIALSIKQVLGEKSLEGTSRRRSGVSDIVHYLADMGLAAKDIAEIVGCPLTSVRTLLTPKRRK
jgi:hypothetical protein